MILLQWATCAVVTILLLTRLPAFLRGHNRLMFWLMTLLDLAVLLSISGPYLAIDRLLGGHNVANLVLRFIIFGFTLLLGVRVARAFSGFRAERALLGPFGLGLLAAASAVLVASFVLSDLATSRVGFNTPDLELWPAIYGTMGRIYPTFTGIVLLPVLTSAVRRRGPALLRWAAALLGLGYFDLAISNIITVLPKEYLWLSQTINYSTILLLCAGLALVWVSSLVGRARARNVAGTQVKNPHT
ncbi:hypothetical protein [Sinomonas humi]|uniref:Integral membrane protein n=1 Tax=Sinomonas humi TaxID=1338436 RepID=A0A0B2APF2_9MICC|nr:hypothetical protein [Sinomonas humi]KHL03864.1 hypothetical protein LK10_08160 [Sinomonas humi]